MLAIKTESKGRALVLVGALVALAACEGPTDAGGDGPAGGAAPRDALSAAGPDAVAEAPLSPLEGASTAPAVVIAAPGPGATYSKPDAAPVAVTVDIGVTGFALGADGSVQWSLDGAVAAVGTGTSFAFPDVPLGVHRLGAVLVDAAGAPVGGASGSASVVVAVSNPCTTTADCAPNNACWTTQCLPSASGPVCKYGPTPDPGCCTTDFDCAYPSTCAPSGANQGHCVACVAAGDCDDGSPCTVDTCNPDGTCSHVKPNPACCETNGDCEDGNPCSLDSCDPATKTCSQEWTCCVVNEDCPSAGPCQAVVCSGKVCRYGEVPGCCTQDADCDDKNPCTVDTCKLATNKCDFSVKVSSNCCMVNADCDDGNDSTCEICVANQCVHTPSDCGFRFQCASDADCGALANACTSAACVAKKCVTAKIAGCCLLDSDCKDGDPCTKDACSPETHLCQATLVGPPACCAADSECDDGVACTKDICLNHECRFLPDPEAAFFCCVDDGSCDDGNGCTVDTCSAGKCTYTADLGKDGCCALSAQCDDGNLCTYDPCVDNVCHHIPKLDGCCTEDCDDGLACTVDICDVGTNKCVHPKLQGACCSDSDCAPPDKCHTATCNMETAQCVPKEVPGSSCCDTTADCAQTATPCMETLCIKGVCHDAPVAGCCVSDADCDDMNVDTNDLCDPATGTCAFLPDVDGEIAEPCWSHHDCMDIDLCTYDVCIAGLCAHIAKDECCEIEGEKGGAACDDGDGCTVDVCLQHRCRHFPTGALAPGKAPGPPGCAPTASGAP